MFRLKMINKPKLFKLKFNFIFPQIVLANMQEKEITPTKETQIVEPDKNYDGLKKVTVNKIPDEYIIPTGEIQINQNGIYNVKDKLTANVNVPIKQLGTKVIDKNGVYNATDDNLDGYSSVDVQTSGVDINEYFETNYTGSAYYMFIKKVPSDITIKGTSCNNMFTNFSKLSEIPNLDTSNVTNMQSMFSGCSSLTTIPQLNTSKVTNMYQFCTNCSSLKIIPQLDTSNVTNMGYAFLGCNNLETIPKLNASKVNNIFWLLSSSNYLVNCGGLENLGMAYLTTQSANYSNYTLELSSCSKLTHDSLINVINNLYDIASAGVQPQKLQLGSTNLAKLTAEEINLATAKGWSVS